MLDGKVALVTGAGRGIGKQIALTLAEKGATVIVNFNGTKEKAQETVQEIEAKGWKAQMYQCDVSDMTSCGEMIAELIKAYGRIDILVNNAGITRDNLLMRMSEEEFDEVIRVNLKGCFNTMKHVSRYMLKQKGGRIINISSVTGLIGGILVSPVKGSIIAGVVIATCCEQANAQQHQ